MSSMIVIPARRASTRLPNKLLLDETGLPLICHTLDTAVRACRAWPDRFGRIIVAVDDAEILDVVNTHAKRHDLPARAMMTRPDHACGTDRIAEVAESLPEEIDRIVNIQGDEPELEPEHILSLDQMLEDAMMATLAYPIEQKEDFENPNLVKVVLGVDSLALYFSRSPIPHHRDGFPVEQSLGLGHIGLYGYRRSTLMRFVSLPQGQLEQLEKLEQLRALENGISIAVGVLDQRPAKGIDTREDYEAFVLRMKEKI